MSQAGKTLDLIMGDPKPVRTEIARILADLPYGQVHRVNGWVKTRRVQGSKENRFGFIHINDGSCFTNLQVVVDADKVHGRDIDEISVGSSAEIIGKVVKSRGKQAIEIVALRYVITGDTDPSQYPIANKDHSVDFLRGLGPLRIRTNTFAAVMRVRSHLSQAIHRFFFDQEFHYMHSPIITTSDAEGAGEMFTVTTLLDDPKELSKGVDFTKDFFGAKASLSVSGQLNAEAFCLGLGKVYTFAPTFRAENSNTSRHLAEFWMVEPEIAFAGMDELIKLAEDMLKWCIRHLLTYCEQELLFLENAQQESIRKDKQNKVKKPKLVSYLKGIETNGFKRVTYTEAIELLQKSKAEFEVPVEWGIDLSSEHEKYLVLHCTKGPTFVTDYPQGIKSFYMRMNEDGKTVQAVDLLIPHIGELIGGSVREERLDKLEARMKACDMNLEDYQWYLDLRRYGSVEHAGFGIGFERLLMMCTGMDNIRDVMPFPRYPKHAPY